MAGSSLRARDLRALLEAVEILHAPVALTEFPVHLFGVLSRLLPGTVASFDFVHLPTGKVASHITPDVVSSVPAAELEAAVRQYAWQNPVVHHLAAVEPATVVQPTDLLSQHAFRRTDFYNLCFRPLDIEYQIAAGLAWPGHAGGLIINRPGPRNFTAREVEIVRCLRPHIEQAFANALLVAELRARLDAKTAGSAPDPRTGNLSAALTAREVEVLRWIGAGKRNAEIATILGVSPRTVDKHVEHPLGKLGVETRTAAASLVWVQ